MCHNKDSDKDVTEVSQILDSATELISTLTAHFLRPQTPRTPQTPQVLTGGLPSTPGPSTQVAYPTPFTPGPIPCTIQPPLSTVKTPKQAMTTKLLGSPPEPFSGKPETADAFWQNLENYYYLNETAYTDEGKRVSVALTHFKLGTPAGDWAQDKQKEALNATP